MIFSGPRGRNALIALLTGIALVTANALALHWALSTEWCLRGFERLLSRELGCRVTIESVFVSWSTRICARGVKFDLGTPDAPETLVSCPEASAQLAIGRAFLGDLYFRRLEFREPLVYLSRPDERWNIETVIDALRREPGKPRKAFPWVPGGQIVVERADVTIAEGSLRKGDMRRRFRELTAAAEMSRAFPGQLEIQGFLEDRDLRTRFGVTGNVDTVSGEWALDVDSPRIPVWGEHLEQLPVVGERLVKELDLVAWARIEKLRIWGSKGEPVQYNLRVKTTDGRLTPSRVNANVSQLSGYVVADGDGVRLEGMEGRYVIGGVGGKVEADGPLVGKSEDEFLTVTLHRVNFTPELVRQIPVVGDRIWHDYEPTGVATATSRLSTTGELKLRELEVTFVDCTAGRIANIPLPTPLTSVTGSLTMRDEELILQDLSGSWAGGRAEGRLRFKAPGFREASGEFTISAADLSLLGEDLGSEKLLGKVRNDMRIASDAEGKVSGSGQIEVRNGYLMKLPLFVRLLDVLQVKTPDMDQGFEEATVRYTLAEDAIEINELMVFSEAVTVYGRGRIYYTKDLEIRLVAMKEGGLLLQWVPFADEIEERIVKWFSRNLVQYDVRGTLDDPRLDSVAVPEASSFFKSFGSELGRWLDAGKVWKEKREEGKSGTP